MTNTIIDFIRLPVNEAGDIIYDLDYTKQLFETYTKVFPEHQAFMLPANITVWEDLDIISLKTIRDCLNEIIEKKEQKNDL